MATQTSNKPDLWQRAIDGLPASVTKVLDTTKTAKRDVALAALEVAKAKRELALKKRWRIKRSSGQEDIIVRDVMEKVIFWIHRFKAVGDQIVQYDPGHAALPWAAFRFLLQAATNDTTIYSGTLEDLEKIASLMARSLELERLYVAATTVLHDQLCEALVKTYAVILHLLARAVKFFNEPAGTRLMKAPFRSLHEEDMKDVLAAEAEVLKIAALIDSERVLNLETQVLRLADFTIATRRSTEEREYLEILGWLSHVPYSRHHASQRDARLPGTGEWLVQHSDFNNWETTSSCSLLLLHGIAGCGKSSLCTAVIEKYLDGVSKMPNTAPLAYFYCNASDPEPERQSAEGVLRSFARQLTCSPLSTRQIHDAVITLYRQSCEQARTDGFELAKASVSECIELILAALADNPATLVIDALDEIEEPKKLVDALQAIISKSGNVLKIFMTTRDDPGIFAMLPAVNRIRVTNEHNRVDIQSFTMQAVSSAISDFKLLMGNVSEALKQRLVDGLISGAGEMFLWVKLQILHLCSFQHETDVLAALDTLSESTLEDLYRTGYERIQRAGNVSHEIGDSIFTWLLYAPELMNTETFLRAVTSTTKLENVTTDTILAIGRGFVILDTQSNVFRFAHGSARDFVSLQNAYRPVSGQRLLSNGCIAILNDFPDDDITAFCPTESLYGYAALYCGHHFSAALSLGEHFDLVQEIHGLLFDDGEPSLCTKVWTDNVRAAYSSLPRHHAQKLAMEIISNKQCSPLFAICVYGLSSVLEQYNWPADYDWDQRNDYGQTCLYAASLFGHTQVAQFLLAQAASVNIECGRFGSALHSAAYRGHVEVVKLLLDHGADNKTGGKFESTVHAACQGNREDVVLAILDHSTIITDREEYDKIVEAVCEAGFPQAIEALETHALGHGSTPTNSSSTVKKVIASGKVASLKYMIRKATPKLGLISGSVALSSLYGHETMTDYLLDQGCDIEEPGELGSPLRCASLKGHGSVCRLLVGRGADVNGNGRFGNALHAAAMKGHAHIAQLLLDMGADVDIKGGYYGTPLQAAAYTGHKEVLSVLLQGGADVHRSGFSRDAFHAAAEGGHHDIIQFLLDSGFTMLTSLPIGHSMASRSGPPPRDLLRESSPDARARTRMEDEPHYDEKSSDENSIDLSNPTPYADAYASNDRESDYILEAAAALGHLQVVKTLLAQKSSRGMTDAKIPEALVVACRYGHQEIIEALLHTMEDSAVPSHEAFEEAAAHGHSTIITMLLARDYGAERKSACLEAALKSSIRSKGECFQEVLTIAQFEIAEKEMDVIMSRCLTAAAADDRGDIVRLILSRDKHVHHQKLVSLVGKSCEKGNLETVKSILAFKPSMLTSEEDLPRWIRSAVEHGRTDVTRHLLPHFAITQANQWHLRCMVLAAAGCGFVDILSLILSGVKDARYEHDNRLLQQALNVSAANGHEDTCAFLLSTGVDPLNSAPAILWVDVSLDRRSYFFKETGETDDSGLHFPKEEAQRKVSNADSDNDSTHPARAEFNAVEACIFGRNHFGDSFGHAKRQGKSKTVVADTSSTLRLLLQHTTPLKDCIRDEAMHMAIKRLDPSLVAMMIEKGANTEARHENLSLAERAATRQPLCFPMMQILMQTTATADMAKAELQQVLSTIFAQFCPTERWFGLEPGFLAGTDTLQDLFTTGTGALAVFLLQLLPEEKLACPAGSNFLQCAAAAGSTDVVKLAIDRKANVNGVGLYYGTAIQAASRFGHASIVRQLLDAKADVNILQGRHHTALRAAVLGRSLETVDLLLEAGANTELSSHGSYSRHKEIDSTPLQLAVQHNELAITQALIAAGAHVEVSQNKRQPPLIEACSHGNISLVNVLLEAGADLQVQCHQLQDRGIFERMHQSALHAAIEAGHVDLIQFLLSKGFNLSADFGVSRSPLVTAVQKEESAILEILLKWDSKLSDEVLIEAFDKSVRYSKSQGFGHEQILFESDPDERMMKKTRREGKKNIIELLLEQLSTRNQVESACNAAMGELWSIRAIAFDSILEYIPCPVDLFVEACFRGLERCVRAGLEQGISPTIIDSKGRPALHLASIQAHVDVAKLLLAHGADSDGQYPSYGTPLMAALERSAAKSDSITSLPDGAKEYARFLQKQTEPFIYVPYRVPVLDDARSRRTEEIVRLLIENGASPDPTPGPFGSTLALAAFLGSRIIFYLLLEHGASLHTVGGYLHSPLLASIHGKNLNMTKHILALSAKQTLGDSVEGNALHVASESISVPAVKLLLQHGMSPHLKNEKGKTPLYISIGKLPRSHRFPRHDLDYVEPSHEEIIVDLLLEVEPQAPIADDIICAASEIVDEEARTKIMQRILPRAESHYFPENAFISLIKASRFSLREGGNLIQNLMDEKRIRCITDSILAAAEYPEMITKLLDYDPEHRTTTGLLDAILSRDRMYSRKMVEVLLTRDEFLIPSSSNVLDVLKQHYGGLERNDKKDIHILETMFSRNPQLRVTEDMLIAVQNTADLRILLARIAPSEKISDKVMLTLAEQNRDFEVVKMILDFDRSATIQPELADHLLIRRGLEGLRCVWNHDPKLCISEKGLLSLTTSRSLWESDKVHHGDIVELLGQHKGQWKVTREVRDAVDSRFCQQSDQDVRSLYYSLWESGKEEDILWSNRVDESTPHSTTPG